MAILSIKNIPFFTDTDGSPLNNGRIYIGVAGLDPANNPRDVFADDICSVKTGNPIPVMHGYPRHNGHISHFYTKGEDGGDDYSILVENRFGKIVLRLLNVGDRYSGTVVKGFSASSIKYLTMSAQADAYDTNLQKKITGIPDIFDYGAVADGVTPANDAIQSMFDDLGYAVIPAGDFWLNETDILLPISFRPGGRIIVPPGQKPVFRNRIDASPKFQIFAGEGDVSFIHKRSEAVGTPDYSLGLGFDGRFAYATWFGIFPRGNLDVMHTSLIQKAMRAFADNPREGKFIMGLSGYNIDDTITVPAGLWFEGMGTVRTGFDYFLPAGKDAFVLGAKTHVSGIQFEQGRGQDYFHDGVGIRMTGLDSRVTDVSLWNSKTGVLIEGSGCRVQQVGGRFLTPPAGTTQFPDDSSLVRIQASNANVHDVRALNQQLSPAAVVWVDAASNNGHVVNTFISAVRGGRGAIPVKVTGTTGNVDKLVISELLYSDNDGERWAVPAVVDMKFLNSSRFSGINISSINGTEATGALVKLHHNTTGNSSGLVITGAIAPEQIPATDPTAQVFNGFLFSSGSVSNVCISGCLSPDLRPVTLGEGGTGSWKHVSIDRKLSEIIRINNNSVGKLSPWVKGRNSAELINYGADPADLEEILTHSGTFAYNVTSAGNFIRRDAGGPNFAVLAAGGAAPTGTTGTAGNISVWPGTDGKLYIENRSGGTVYVTIRI